MAQFTKTTGANGTVRYKDGTQFVAADKIPASAKEALDNSADGTIIDETGEVFDPTTDTDEGSEDENLAPAAPADDTTDAETPAEDEEVEEDEEPAPAPKSRNSRKQEMGGMGFPAKNGKTLSIFSDKPHETVKNVGGVMVPLTHEEYGTKTDAEILVKLRDMGKIA